ncbi:hypothetical protein [Sulfuritalea sp.]|uniref:hypothetical protein n=1 Tax=Sulfuritalea sp. TaxID=2480090 RepID=UPI001AC54650|nr:hypothetical protein [Sulfuritalea sp.]MBN8476772.1 hypothetical protein [Sulfuritalea sp.]
MSGLFFFGVIAAWGAVAFLMAKRVTRLVQSRILGLGLGALAFVLMIVLPVVDEIVGGYQFRALCRQNAVLRIDAEKAKGRKVRVVFEPLNEVLPGNAIAIFHSHKSYRDVVTNEEIASNEWYLAKGGWFIRLLGVSETNDPITFSPSACYPSITPQEIAGTYGITLIK